MINNQYGDIPNEVRWARLQAGISTQRELARLSGIHPSIISALERGRRKMSARWAYKIAKVTGASYEDLMKMSNSNTD